MTIAFITKGYDSFIDFIKAYAILCVLIGHSMLPLEKMGYCAWAGMQVPLFILVQSFHFYKKNQASIKIGKILRRVILPFLIIEFTTALTAYGLHAYNCNTLIDKLLASGGYGPGSYYPWIYLQVALLLPISALLLKSVNKTSSLIIFLIVCEGLEILFSFSHVSEPVYRLLAARYIFLLYIGWLWTKEGIIINRTTVLLATFSLISIIYFQYFSRNDEPWFFSTGWKYHRWPCYYYVAYGLTSILYYIWTKINRNEVVLKIVKTLAASSYEIFLIQMTVRFLFQKDYFLFQSKILTFALWLMMFWIVSIFGGILLNILLYNRNNVLYIKDQE